MSGSGSAYRDAGVDIDAQEEALRRVKELARSTFGPEVLSEIGSFGGLFRPDLGGIEEPVLVASADGVGTKLMVAARAGDFGNVGRDLVNHCVDDVLVQGAVPLFFLDYVAAGRLEPDAVVQVVEGVAAACRENGCALLGGETAEMPGLYPPGELELVGFVVGLADRSRLLDGSRVGTGDVLVGLPSSGLHTNGYSLARKVLFEVMGLEVGDRLPGSDDPRTVGEILLTPHRSYLREVRPLLGHRALHAIAHVTGGGLTDNLPRVLGAGRRAEVSVGSWEVPELFRLLAERGEVGWEEMFRVFNMGLGLVLVVAPDGLREVLGSLRRSGLPGRAIGTVQEGGSGVVYDLESRDTDD